MQYEDFLLEIFVFLKKCMSVTIHSPIHWN